MSSASVRTVSGFKAGDRISSTSARILIGAPSDKISVLFDGGEQVTATGDKFRLAGDGTASGGTYTPSATEPNAGILNVLSNQFQFKGVEPLVVHGLVDFQVTTTDAAAVLEVSSISVNDLELANLVLQVVTIDGVVSWTQEAKLSR